MPFVASWRTFEKTLNPAVSFILSCAHCDQQNMEVINSKKIDRTIIGLQCQTEGCGQTIKFEKPISMDDESMPERFLSYPKGTALTGEHIGEQRTDKQLLKAVTNLFEEVPE